MLPAGELEFAGHEAQTPDPATALNFPATHCVHDPPLDPDEPALQEHAVEDELPAGASESNGQSVHVVAPTADEYLLMSHAVHVSDPAAAVNLPKPQSLQTETPEAAPYLPATHKVHTAEEVADEVAEYFPVLHDAQVVADEVAEYLPTSQSKHCASPLV